MQTFKGITVWQAGLAVQVAHDPLRVLGAQFTGEQNIDMSFPASDKIEKLMGLEPEHLHRILNLSEIERRLKNGNLLPPVINYTNLWIYRYESADREHKHGDRGQENEDFADLFGFHPALPIPPVADTIEEGSFYVVVEVLFSLLVEGWGSLNWRALIEVETESILYIEALVDSVDAFVFPSDPISLSGNAANTPASNNTTLNMQRRLITLAGLNSPAGSVQSLAGEYVSLQDFYLPTIAPPIQPVGGNFNYPARTNNFAAANAYHHCDALFRMVAGMGFNISTYFDGTTFPVPVEHRRSADIDGIFGGSTDNNGNQVNAQSLGNAAGNGQGGLNFFLADTTDTVNPLGIAADWRVVLHEFGHTILWDHVNWANFRFAHSAGDALAAILNDPTSLAPDRFETFPWTFLSLPASTRRRHDRAVVAGWGWSGNIALNPFNPMLDPFGYNNEQILSTTLFRFYRSIGGGSSTLSQRQFAARFVAYLILRAVGTLTPATNPNSSLGFANALILADGGAWASEGQTGGAYNKVIRWAFERQGLYQPPGTPTPNNNEGAPPDVDVYIDDGRGGNYTFLANHWSTTDIWNRTSIGDGGGVHQHPIVNRTNHAYVRIKNRGTQTATNIVVKGFHCRPGIGLIYPGDWQAMTTSQLSGPNLPPGATAVVGPFSWVPSQLNHECMFLSISTPLDPSNIDGRITGSIPDWRLVPNDNNIGQRNVAPVAGAAGSLRLAEDFSNVQFTIRNALNVRAFVRLEVQLPPILRERDWSIDFTNAGGSALQLGPSETMEVVLQLAPGRPFTREDLVAAEDSTIHILGYANDILLGGMSYYIDPTLERVIRSPEDADTAAQCQDVAQHLLTCIDFSSAVVKKVKVRSINIDIELNDDYD